MTQPPRVLIDARELTGDSAYSGVGTYIRGLLGALATRTDVHTMALATNDAPIPAGVDRKRIIRFFPDRRRAIVEHAMLIPLDAARTRADVFHSPLFHAPFGITKPWVQTLLDVIPLIDDDPALEPLRRRWQRFGKRYRRADAIVAISRRAADDGIQHLGLDPRRVHVTHLGVSPKFSPDGPRVESAEPYLLVVSQFSRRKGFAEAMDVIAAVADAGFPHRLKLVGRIPAERQAELDNMVAAAARPDRVDVLGYVDDVAALYRGAAAVLVLSRFEGFGLPAAEAMASGVPVVAFDNSSLPEIVGDGGLLVPDGDVAAAADATLKILRERGLAEDLAGRARDRAGLFTWDRCAQLTAEVYREVAAR